MSDARFKIGDVVQHRASRQRGVVIGVPAGTIARYKIAVGFEAAVVAEETELEAAGTFHKSDCWVAASVVEREEQ